MGKDKEQKNTWDGQLLLTVTDKRQAIPLVREGAPQRQDSKFQTELISGRKFHSALDTKTYWLTDWPTVSRNVTSASSQRNGCWELVLISQSRV
jgi:hypothetical protein